MKRFLSTLLLSCLLTGCIITQHNDLHNIINKNYELYETSKQVEFNNVAAILKTFSHLINSKKYRNFQGLEKDRNNFIKQLKDKPISNNYPVQANEDEIQIVNGFLKDVTNYLKKEDVPATDFQRYINQTSTTFITELLIYEEKIP